MNNSYQPPSKLLVEKDIILSQDGTTQGDPLATAMYGIATLPLISCIATGSMIQNWYADDGSAAEKLTVIRDLFDCFFLSGKPY